MVAFEEGAICRVFLPGLAPPPKQKKSGDGGELGNLTLWFIVQMPQNMLMQEQTVHALKDEQEG